MMGFIGPKEEGDDVRCPFCRDDPMDPTLHSEDCPLLTNGNCGVARYSDETWCLEQDTRGHPHVFKAVR